MSPAGPKRSRRWLAPFVLAVLLTPGLYLRDPDRRPDRRQVLSVTKLAVPARRLGHDLTLIGAWRLESPNSQFGGYSALVPLPGGRLGAFGDSGAVLLFDPPGSREPHPVRIAGLGQATGTVSKRTRDCEAVTLDPRTGDLWAAYERSNAIVRLSPELRATGRIRPAAMRDWPVNGGPEAMVRLADGRFIVVAETRDQAGLHPALLFDGDPVEGARGASFRYRAPRGFRPTDMAQLPDGRVLVLNRRLSFPFRFAAALTLVDPREIAAGRPWHGREIARLAAPVPLDNYEGLAVTPAPDGTVTLWLISDDNNAQRLQRTLLLALRWNPARAAGED